MNYKTTKVFFSPGNTCSKIINIMSENLPGESKTINLLTDKIETELFFSPGEVLLIALPVFIGRIPVVTVDMLHKLKGENAYAIPVVAYGNISFGDSLLELTDILKENGFIIPGAAAIVAKHSMFPGIASNRPDSSDTDKIKKFMIKCLDIMKETKQGSIQVPGNRPYKPLPNKALPLSLRVGDTCNECKICANICPEEAISLNNPKITDTQKCNNCTACIHGCPQSARNFGGLGFFLISKLFKFFGSKRKEPDFFYLSN